MHLIDLDMTGNLLACSAHCTSLRSSWAQRGMMCSLEVVELRVAHPEALHGATDARQLLRLLCVNLQDRCIELADGALGGLLQLLAPSVKTLQAENVF